METQKRRRGDRRDGRLLRELEQKQEKDLPGQ